MGSVFILFPLSICFHFSLTCHFDRYGMFYPTKKLWPLSLLLLALQRLECWLRRLFMHGKPSFPLQRLMIALSFASSFIQTQTQTHLDSNLNKTTNSLSSLIWQLHSHIPFRFNKISFDISPLYNKITLYILSVNDLCSYIDGEM